MEKSLRNKDQEVVVIIGPGLDGLACGALLAKDGFRVIIIPDGYPLGGAAQPVKLAGYSYNNANYIMDCRCGALSVVLNALGIELDYKPLDPVDRVVLPGLNLCRPRKWDDYKKMLLEIFPDEEESLKSYFDITGRLGSEWLALINHEKEFNPINFPYMAKFYRKTYTGFIEELFRNPLLKGLLLVGIPASDISLAVMAGHLIGQVFDACHTVAGPAGIIELLRKTFINLGGELISEVKVKNILIREQAITGVELEDGRKIRCFCLISTYDDYTTYTRYMPDFISGYTNKNGSLSRRGYFNAYYSTEESWPGPEPVYYGMEIPDVDKLMLQEEGMLEKPFIYKIVPEVFYHDCLFAFKVETELGPVHYQKWLDTNGLEDTLINQQAYQESLLKLITADLEGYKPGWRIKAEGGISPRGFASLSGMQEGMEKNWAFSTTEIMKNPLNPKRRPDNMVISGYWGWAWFSAALVSARIVQKLKMRD